MATPPAFVRCDHGHIHFEVFSSIVFLAERRVIGHQYLMQTAQILHPLANATCTEPRISTTRSSEGGGQSACAGTGRVVHIVAGQGDQAARVLHFAIDPCLVFGQRASGDILPRFCDAAHVQHPVCAIFV
jgi:hypothetical protein